MKLNLNIDSIAWTDFYDRCMKRLQEKLEEALPTITNTHDSLQKAMHYAVFSGGKRLRPMLVYATGYALGAKLDHLDAPAVAVELMHTYSLIHDDLPAMDNDELRRGKPTCHVAFDEATAILAGDALQSLAFSLLAKPYRYLKPHLQIQMIRTMAKMVGAGGMAGGQALDLQANALAMNPALIEEIHALKTGALFNACVQLGALCAGHDNALILNPLSQFARTLGIAFQIQDDLADNCQADATSYLKIADASNAKASASFYSRRSQSTSFLGTVDNSTMLAVKR
jgi:farnesyl diphosphate synthase